MFGENLASPTPRLITMGKITVDMTIRRYNQKIEKKRMYDARRFCRQKTDNRQTRTKRPISKSSLSKLINFNIVEKR